MTETLPTSSRHVAWLFLITRSHSLSRQKQYSQQISIVSATSKSAGAFLVGVSTIYTLLVANFFSSVLGTTGFTDFWTTDPDNQTKRFTTGFRPSLRANNRRVWLRACNQPPWNQGRGSNPHARLCEAFTSCEVHMGLRYWDHTLRFSQCRSIRRSRECTSRPQVRIPSYA